MNDDLRLFPSDLAIDVLIVTVAFDLLDCAVSETLSDVGGGRFYHVGNPQELGAVVGDIDSRL